MQEIKYKYWLLVLGLFFLSCNNFPGNKNFPKENFSTENLDTVRVISYPVSSKPEIFETAYFKGAKSEIESSSVSFYSVNIGKIKISSGKMIAGDPIVIHDAEPFLQNFPTGSFPVQLAIAKIDGDERITFSRIWFTDSPVMKWEFALLKGQSPIPVGGETFYGYGVDAGTGMFIDKEARDAYSALYKADDGIWNRIFIEEMDKHYRHTRSYAVYEFDKHNLAAFSTGYGDGRYGTYVGYDSKGNICRLLTDFGLVDWWNK